MTTSTPDELYDLLEQFLMRLLGLGESEGMDALIEMDLSFSQARTLFVLAQRGDTVPINEVAQVLKLSLASTGRNVDQLVTAGLVERREDENDRRIRRVSLTEAGRTIVGKHLDAKRHGLRVFTGNVPAEDRDRLCASLRPILAGDCLNNPPQEIC